MTRLSNGSFGEKMRQNWIIIKGLVLVGFMFLTFIVPTYVVFAESSTKWVNTYGGAGDDQGYSVIKCDDGYVFVGITNSFDLGRYDVLLIKTDSSGIMEWNRTYGGPFNDMAYSLVATTDGGYALAGSTNSFGSGNVDFWLVKVDSLGNLEWNQTYDSQDYDSCRSLVATSDGGYALLGFTGSGSFGFGNSDVWLVKVDSLGNMEWNQTYGGDGSDSVSAIIETADGGYALGCSTTSFGAGSADFWLIKVDSLGNMEWNQTFGESGAEYANSLVVTADGGYALGGSTSSFGAVSADVLLVKVDSLGNPEWNQTYGGSIADYCDSMTVSSDGGYTLACISQPPVRTSTQPFGDGVYWLIKVDSFGNMELNQTYGVSAHHSHTSLLITAEGGYILGGSTRDNSGNQDFWLAKIGETDSGLEVLFLISVPLLVLSALILVLVYRRTHNSKSSNSE